MESRVFPTFEFQHTVLILEITILCELVLVRKISQSDQCSVRLGKKRMAFMGGYKWHTYYTCVWKYSDHVSVLEIAFSRTQLSLVALHF